MKLSKFHIWIPRLSILGAATGILFVLFGRLFAPFDIFAHFTPHFAIILFSGCLAEIFQNRAMPILAIGAVATLGIHPAIATWNNGGEWTRAAQAATADPSSDQNPARLKVISLNSWHSHPAPGAIGEFIKRENPDLVVLLEFGPNKRTLLNQLQNTYPYKADCSERWHCSVAVLSKRPISAHGSGGPETTIPAHAWITVKVDGQDFTIIGAHMHRPIDGMNRHRRQLIGLSKLAKKISGAVLVTGDFNTTRWADSYNLFAKVSGLTPMQGYLPTWPAQFPQLAIDHMFHNYKARVTHAKTAPTLGSDHLPLIASVRFD